MKNGKQKDMKKQVAIETLGPLGMMWKTIYDTIKAYIKAS